MLDKRAASLAASMFGGMAHFLTAFLLLISDPCLSDEAGWIYSPSMATLKIIKLSDEFGQCIIHLQCACGHIRRCLPRALAGFAGWDAKLEDVVKRLRCSKCGKKTCTASTVE